MIKEIEDYFEKYRREMESQGELVLKLKIHPGAKQTAIKQIMADGSIKMDVAAQPEKSKANEALVAWLADEFSLSKAVIRIKPGKTSKTKLVEIKPRRPD